MAEQKQTKEAEAKKGYQSSKKQEETVEQLRQDPTRPEGGNRK